MKKVKAKKTALIAILFILGFVSIFCIKPEDIYIAGLRISFFNSYAVGFMIITFALCFCIPDIIFGIISKIKTMRDMKHPNIRRLEQYRVRKESLNKKN